MSLGGFLFFGGKLIGAAQVCLLAEDDQEFSRLIVFGALNHQRRDLRHRKLIRCLCRRAQIDQQGQQEGADQHGEQTDFHASGFSRLTGFGGSRQYSKSSAGNPAWILNDLTASASDRHQRNVRFSASRCATELKVKSRASSALARST